jgi:hypothetical protein
VVLLVACILVVSLVWPWQECIAPRWRITVVLRNGEAAQNVRVLESWGDYAVEPLEHLDEGRTDAFGVAEFPEHTTRLSVWQRIGGALKALRIGGVHASLGRVCYIVVGGSRGTQHVEAIHKGGCRCDTKVVID